MANRKIQPLVRRQVKQNRNDLCKCGSGKKYKKCCLPIAKILPPAPASPNALEQVIKDIEKEKQDVSR